MNGGPAGDLFVTVSIRPHPIFTRSRMCRRDPDFVARPARWATRFQVPTIDETQSGI